MGFSLAHPESTMRPLFGHEMDDFDLARFQQQGVTNLYGPSNVPVELVAGLPMTNARNVGGGSWPMRPTSAFDPMEQVFDWNTQDELPVNMLQQQDAEAVDTFKAERTALPTAGRHPTPIRLSSAASYGCLDSELDNLIAAAAARKQQQQPSNAQ